MTNKTIIVTIPKPLPRGAQVKGIVTSPFVVNPRNSHQTQVIKMEYEDQTPSIVIKEPRKRQKLDHLTQEQKSMRR